MGLCMRLPPSSGSPPITVAALTAARMQGLVEGSMDAIISMDAQMCIVLFNPAAASIFGISMEDALGRSIEDFIPKRFRDAHRGHVQAFGQHKYTRRTMGQGGQIVGLRANLSLGNLENCTLRQKSRAILCALHDGEQSGAGGGRGIMMDVLMLELTPFCVPAWCANVSPDTLIVLT